MKNKKIKQNKGQIAIMVLLVSAIVLTLGLSASKKAVTDTKVDTDEQLLKEAFNAAESGINNYILNKNNVEYNSENGSKSTVSSSIIGESKELASEGLVIANNNQLFWLVAHDSDGKIDTNNYYSSNINLSPASGFVGALKVDYFYIDSLNVYRVQHLACNYGGSTIISIPSADCSTIDVTGKKSLLLSVTPLGASTKITLTGSNNFPNQGEELTAVGTAGDGIKTQIKTRNIYQIPSFMLEAITAGNMIQ